MLIITIKTESYVYVNIFLMNFKYSIIKLLASCFICIDCFKLITWNIKDNTIIHHYKWLVDIYLMYKN